MTVRSVGLVASLLVGVAGWALLLLAPSLVSAPAMPVGATGLGLFALFVVVILTARSMAFRVADDNVLSLDSAFYVAAAFCLGSVLAGRVVALALTLDALLRMALADRRHQLPAGGGAEAYGYVLYFGGMSGGLLLACSWLFAVDDTAVAEASHAALALRVAAVAVAFLVGHYALQGARLALLGASLRDYLRHQALPSIVAELLLIPIGILLVVLYQPSDRLAFLLLCATYLLLHYVFSRLRRTSVDLERRVRDLETLGETARTVASALELEELVEAVARETCRAVPGAEAVSLVHRGPERETERLLVDSYDRDADRFTRFTIGRGEGAVGRVMATRRSLRVADLSREEGLVVGGDGAGVRSWLGVPIIIGDGVEGVLAIQSGQGGAFGPAEQRLLEAIGHQVAAALQNAHLYQMAMVDGLTGLFVRRYFDARIEEEIERSRRYGTPFSVVMIDIDDFKALNDQHGHLAGDRVLRAVSAVVRGQMRGVDTAARYGGEELALILPRTEMVAAYNQAERIRAAIAEQRVAAEPGSAESSLSVSASFGIAAFPECLASSGEDLVRKADRALYRAKRMGKNRVELFWVDDADAAPPEVTS
ncbi:MAG: sensor domain-containing diguanylate cyclase [Kofleriaceae bacterium]|nr:sensor domain-containing diguanylate cyclase [Kofleriaceae bacterium]MBP6839261.1 sensor domain-containing diguanylate cyclase [Kofleriaceae bacterium]